jgi:invasion protein IalB
VRRLIALIAISTIIVAITRLPALPAATGTTPAGTVRRATHADTVQCQRTGDHALCIATMNGVSRSVNLARSADTGNWFIQ